MKGTKGNIVQAIEGVKEVSHLLSPKFKWWFEEASGVLTRYWEGYTATESYKNQMKYKKRVKNREKLYKKKIQKYGKF